MFMGLIGIIVIAYGIFSLPRVVSEERWIPKVVMEILSHSLMTALALSCLVLGIANHFS